MKISDLAAELKIDRFDLDNEIERSAEVYWKIAEATTLVRSRLDQSKADLELVKAELDEELRASTERVTEQAILMAITRDPRRVEANSVYLKQKRILDRLEQLRESFEKRGYALRDLASLWGSGYYQQNFEGTMSKAKDMRADYNRQRMTEKRRARE